MKQEENRENFKAPTVEQVRDLIKRNGPRVVSVWVARLPMIVMIALVGVILVTDNEVAVMLPWLAFMGIMVWTILNVKRAKKAEARTNQLSELAMQRRYVQAIREAWVFLSERSVRGNPVLYIRVLSVIGHCLHEVGSYEAGTEVYNYMIEHVPSGNAQAMQMKAYRAIAWLMDDQLADADDAIRGLRHVREDYKNTVLSASVFFAELLQCVKTNSFEEGIGMAEKGLEELRPMGIEAGYGHGLIALCYVKHGEFGGEWKDEHENGVKLWWERAKCLIEEKYLLRKLPELGAVVEKMKEGGEG